MCSYDELLFELGELPAVVKNASPLVQLCMLITFNSMIYIGSEMVLKFFHVDLLGVIAGFVGVNMAGGTAAAAAHTPVNKPTQPAAAFAAFSANFQ